MNERRLRIIRQVRGDWPIGHLSVAEPRVYEPNEILVNIHGAVSVMTPQGWLGIKPDEMEWIEP